MAGTGGIEAGRAALEAGRWEDAVAAFESVLAESETGAALDGIAEALWWLCDARASLRFRERAFVRFREEGDEDAACRAAVDLSVAYLVNLGNDAAARGWLARAERVIGDEATSSMQGWLWLMRGFLSSDPVAAQAHLSRALAWGRETADVDVELVALGDLGLALVMAGRADEGLALLDEAMAGTLAGEFKSLDTVVYTSCNMLAACSHLGDLERAAQWCAVADDFMTRYSCPFLFARCRVHYGSVLLAKGEWERAEEELQSALTLAADAGPGPHGEAVARLAELRSRQGRLEEAEALLRQLNDSLVPLAAAELRLIRGEPSVAVALLERRLEQLGEASIDAAPTLGLLVDAHIACGHLDAASEGATRLAAIAQRGSTYAAALSALAVGHLAMANEMPGSIKQLENALDMFARLDMPLEAGRIRLEIAEALAEHQREVAITEAELALAAFDDLGATADADAAAAFLRSLGAGRRIGRKHAGSLTKREQEVLQLVGLGLSNPEIAQRLFISRKTAAHHVSNLLAKLGLRNRAEAVAYSSTHERPSS